MCFKHLHCLSLKHATKVNNIEHAVDLKINIDIHVRHRTNMNIPISWLFLMKFKLYNIKVSKTNILQTLTQTVLTNHRGGGEGRGCSGSKIENRVDHAVTVSTLYTNSN